MKKSIAIIVITFICILCSIQPTYAKNENANSKNTNTESTGANGSWANEAISAAQNFLKEETVDEIGISPIFELFKSMVKAVNRFLLVLLSGISIVALSVTGVRYMASGAAPGQKAVAQQSLKTIFKGMTIGFGAYFIWRIAMSLVTTMIGAFS